MIAKNFDKSSISGFYWCMTYGEDSHAYFAYDMKNKDTVIFYDLNDIVYDDTSLCIPIKITLKGKLELMLKTPVKSHDFSEVFPNLMNKLSPSFLKDYDCSRIERIKTRTFIHHTKDEQNNYGQLLCIEFKNNLYIPIYIVYVSSQLEYEITLLSSKLLSLSAALTLCENYNNFARLRD